MQINNKDYFESFKINIKISKILNVFLSLNNYIYHNQIVNIYANMKKYNML